MGSDNESYGDAVEASHFIRHVTVRQLLEANQIHSTAPFKIEGKEFERFILVANICYLEEREKYRDIGLDDGTGRIKGREWNNNQGMKNNGERFQVSKFPYVRVAGELEQFRNRNVIKIISLEVSLDAHEPYYHLLHAIHDTLVYDRGPPPIYIFGTTARGVSDTEDSDLESRRTNNYAPHPSSEPQFSSPRVTPVTTPTYATNHGESHRIIESDKSVHKIPERQVMPDEPTTQPQQLAKHAAKRVSPPSSSSPSIPSAPLRQSRRSFQKYDPYSSLTALERGIILCIKTSATQYAEKSIYPSVGTSRQNEVIWKGLHISDIVTVLSSRDPTLSPEELHGAFEHLLDESYIFSPVDEDFFDCI